MAGFEVIDSSFNDEAEDLDKDNDNSFGSAFELNGYININGPDLIPGKSYKANIGDLEIIIKVDSNGIRDVNSEDFF